MSEPKKESLDKMWKYVKGFAEKSGTAMHPMPAVTEAVVKGLAMHIDELGKPLCPCNFYKDKAAEAKLRRWMCACDEMQIYKYCHCQLLSGKTACRSRNISRKATKAGKSTASSPIQHPTKAARSNTRQLRHRKPWATHQSRPHLHRNCHATAQPTSVRRSHPTPVWNPLVQQGAGRRA